MTAAVRPSLFQPSERLIKLPLSRIVSGEETSDVSDDDEYDQDKDDKNIFFIHTPLLDKNRLLFSPAQPRATSALLLEISEDDEPRRKKSQDDDEWVLISSEGERAEDSPQLTFAKRIPKLELPEVFQLRLLLLGLLLSGSTLNLLLKSEKAAKPLLKRSSTTGVMTVERSHPLRLAKPLLLFLKRYALLADLERLPVLFVEEPARESEGRDFGLLTKQTSQVGLLNFRATSTTLLSTLSPEPDLSSSLSRFQRKRTSPGLLKSLLLKSSLHILGLFRAESRRPLDRHGSNETIRSVHSDEPPKSIRVAPLPTRDFEPSVQISDSLRDLIFKDHRLGKVPMPERVVSDEDFKRERLEDSSDYHLKGW